MITSYGRIVIIFILAVLLLALLPILAGVGAVGFLEDDVPDDVSMINDIPFIWIRIPVGELSALLTLGLSVFALFVVYLGGRSKHRRFNDRTIDANSVSILISLYLKTAQRGAVFNFINRLQELLINVQLSTEGGTKQ